MAKKKAKNNKKRAAGSNEYSAPKRRRGLLVYMPAFCSLVGTLMLLTVIAAALPLTVPQYMGYQIYDVVSGSMEPTERPVQLLEPRDLLPERPEPPLEPQGQQQQMEQQVPGPAAIQPTAQELPI